MESCHFKENDLGNTILFSRSAKRLQRDFCGEFVRSAWKNNERNVEEKLPATTNNDFESVFQNAAENSTTQCCEETAACLRRHDFSTDSQHSSQQQGSFIFVLGKNLGRMVDCVLL